MERGSGGLCDGNCMKDFHGPAPSFCDQERYFCTRFQVYFGKGVNGPMLLRQNPIPIKAAPGPPPVLAASGLLDTQRSKDFIAK